MEIALILVTAVLLIVVVAAVSPRVGVSPPLLLVVVGIAISFLPFIPEHELNPEIVLIGILPPLLFSAAYNTSFIDFRANRRTILSLSVGLVIFTTVVVGFAASWLIEGLPLAAGFALGALVAPPDAVAATAVARRVGMPKQIVSVLEGESLVNDATALTALRAATLAVGGTVTVLEVGIDFLIAAVGGIVVGVLVAVVVVYVRRRMSNPIFDTVISFTIPYVAYLPAEQIHASGVLAVVVAGLLIGHKAPLLASGSQRLTAEGNWRTVAFVLENAVFLMIGLQLRGLLDNLENDRVSWTVVVSACIAVFVVAAICRVIWVMGEGWLRRIPVLNKRADTLSWPMRVVVSWAGMRGVVTLAAAIALPFSFPQRDLVIVVALVVVIGSILIQGLSLPWLVKAMKLQAPDPTQQALQEAAILDRARFAGLHCLDEVADSEDPEVIARLRSRTELRSNDAWERAGRASHGGETPTQTYQRLRLMMLQAERTAVIAARDDGSADDEVIRNVIRVLDVEEAMLDRTSVVVGSSQDDLTSPESASTCEHLAAADTVLPPELVTAGQCDACLAAGTTWVSLRMCWACGNVACCDSSPAMHADKHFRETQHPVMQSAEPGESWRWCYIDRILG